MARRLFKPFDGAKENQAVVINASWKVIDSDGTIEMLSGSEAGVASNLIEIPPTTPPNIPFTSRQAFGFRDSYSEFLGATFGVDRWLGSGDGISEASVNDVAGVIYGADIDPTVIASYSSVFWPGEPTMKAAVWFQWLQLGSGKPAPMGSFYDSIDEASLTMTGSFWFRNSSI